MEAPLPSNEAERLQALHHYQILDTLPEACFDDISHLASEICNTPIALVSFIDSERQWFKSRKGLDVAQTPRDIAFCAHAILDTDLMVVADAHEDARFADNPLVTGDMAIRFYAGAPLITDSGEALGTLCVIDRERRALTDAQTNALRALSRQVMAQLELRRHLAAQQEHQLQLQAYQRELEDSNVRLERASLTDDVSGFFNTRFLHRYLDELLAQAQAQERGISLAFFDMDGFKAVVDTHGHLLGAQVLREVAESIHHLLDPEDRIVRYGGDEYVVVLPGQKTEEAIVKVERMRERIASMRYLQTEGLDVQVSASFGLANYPDDAATKRELLAAADQCLFYSKEAGRNRVTRAS